ncbi:peptide/nickel transport system substrate-binding protein [Bhargavaea beijingensis]|uniref:Peptide/nickel transport system substrate-binding protein n=1 Tax=Bhargavaea beijingensis TaxID=426756 RepID=A0A1G7A300_9BACL|nr:peptide-binding protein [Bhargavaea beijingensis]SDE09209.1 peptide/nickel transport system substrate-binding protein [Bhargavaea beijingensis]
MFRKRLWLVVTLAMAMLIAACSQPEEAKNIDANAAEKEGAETAGGNLILATTAAPTLFNPYYSTDTSSSTIEGFIFSGLVTVDQDFNPEGDLAESWDFSDDGLKWTFHLRENVKWHDGEPMTADDVVFSYNIPRDPDYVGPRGLPFEIIEEVNKIDDYTVEFVLSEPYAPFITITAQFEVLPKHILGDVPIAELGKHPFNTKEPIGTGPFKFKEWKEGEYIALEANEDYHLGAPKLDGLLYKIVPDTNTLMAQLQVGEISMAGISPEYVGMAQDLESKGMVKLESGPSNAFEYIGYNLRNELFQDKKVRHALTHAIDREAIIEAILGSAGTVAHGPGSPANWAFNPDVPKFEYDIEKAKQLLREAGWKPGPDGILQKDGKKFEFALKTTSANEIRQQIAEVAQQQWAEIGIKTSIEVLEWSAYVEQTSPPNWNFDAMVAGWSIGSDPDPTWFWHTSEIEAGLNYNGYSNPKVDELLSKNTQIADLEERKAVIAEADAIVTEDQPNTFIYYPEGYLAISPKLAGPTFNAANTYYKIHEWYFES